LAEATGVLQVIDAASRINQAPGESVQAGKFVVYSCADSQPKLQAEPETSTDLHGVFHVKEHPRAFSR
jgi:hypothetical protein